MGFAGEKEKELMLSKRMRSMSKKFKVFCFDF